jgi:non-ribosomal peptide synthetase component F
VRQNQTLARVVEGYEVEARDRIAVVDRRVAELRVAVGATTREAAQDLGVETDIAPAARASVTNDDVELGRGEAGEVMLF